MDPQSALSELIPHYEHFLSELVRVPSVRGQEGKAQALIRSCMEAVGLEVDCVYSRDDDQAINLSGRLRGTSPAICQSLVLNAHCDVAPIDRPEAWSRNPFSGDIVDKILHGRGALDDKAGIAVALLVADALRRSGARLGGDLLIQSVIEDETSGGGSQALVAAGHVGDGVVICDGTWPWRIIHSHLGQVFADVQVRGDPVAACVEFRGVNPAYIAIELLEKLHAAVAQWASEAKPFQGIERPFFVNLGSFHSGAWYGSVPVDARLQLQIGFAGVKPKDILSRLQRIAALVSDRITVSPGTLQVAAWDASQGNRMVGALREVVEHYGEQELRLQAVTGHCDMQYFPTPDVCLYGPGGGKNPHGVDEVYFLDHMPIVARNLIDLALRWCNQPKAPR